MSFVQSSSFTPKYQDKIIGLVLFLSIAITIYSIYIVKSKQLDLEEWPYFFATIDQSNGIEVNSNVKLSGVVIGNVVEVKLQRDTSVRLKFLLNPKYNDFYTKNSYLKIDSELAINTVLEGGSLKFYPGNSNEIMLSGSSFLIKLPQTMSDIVDEWQADKIVDKAKDMITNLQSITHAVEKNNDQIDTILRNLGSISNELKVVSEKLPMLVDNLNLSNHSIQKGINRFNESIDLVKKPLNDFFKNADQLAINSNKRIKQIEPTITQLNQLLISLNQTSKSVTQLSDKLSNNWLLGSEQDGFKPAPIILMEERDLYDIDLESPNETK